MILKYFQCLPGTRKKLRLALSSLENSVRFKHFRAIFFLMDLELNEIDETCRCKNLTRDAVDAILSIIKERASRKEGTVRALH